MRIRFCLVLSCLVVVSCAQEHGEGYLPGQCTDGTDNDGDALSLSHNLVLADIDGLSNLTSVDGNLDISGNQALCQSSVDAFLAACTSCGLANTGGNNDGC